MASICKIKKGDNFLEIFRFIRPAAFKFYFSPIMKLVLMAERLIEKYKEIVALRSKEAEEITVEIMKISKQIVIYLNVLSLEVKVLFRWGMECAEIGGEFFN